MDGGGTTKGCKSRWLLSDPRKWEMRSGEKGELDDLGCVGLAWPLPLASGCGWEFFPRNWADVTGSVTPLGCEDSWVLAMNGFLSQLGGSELS